MNNRLQYETKNVLGLKVADVTLSNIAPIIISMIESPGKRTFFMGNIHTLNLYKQNKKFKVAMDNASFIYPDGKGAVFASMLLGNGLKGRTNFLDFVFELLKYAESKKWSLYFLGGKEEVLKKAIKNLKKRYPSLATYGPDKYFTEEKTPKIIQEINRITPKILFVSMGSPKQEIWIHQHMHKIHAKAFFGTGGSVDVIAGRVPRAPVFLRSNFESLYRIYKEPKRLLIRYLFDGFKFIFHLFVQILYNATDAK